MAAGRPSTGPANTSGPGDRRSESRYEDLPLTAHISMYVRWQWETFCWPSSFRSKVISPP
jgi:hypothetical protein